MNHRRQFIIILLIMMVAISGCTTMSSSNTEDTTFESTTTDSTTTEGDWDAFIPSYDDYDQEIFQYASVYIYLENNTQDKTLFLSQSGLDHANYDEVYLSTYTSLILLIYKSKTNLLNDFYLIQNVYLEGDINRPIIEINTLMKSFEMTSTNTVEDLVEVTDQYFGTEIDYDMIDYQMIEEVQMEMLPKSSYTTYQDYLQDYSSNRFELSESDFLSNVLLIISFGHSSSLSIQGFDLFYESQGVLELAIKGDAMSIQMAEDFRPYSVVMMIPQEDFQENTQIVTHFHTHYLDGTYADRPYHNTIDDEINE